MHSLSYIRVMFRRKLTRCTLQLYIMKYESMNAAMFFVSLIYIFFDNVEFMYTSSHYFLVCEDLELQLRSGCMEERVLFLLRDDDLPNVIRCCIVLLVSH